MTYTAEMAHAAVARGAAWLDEQCPDWISRIDLAVLDLAKQSHCVLGQTAECLTGAPVRSSYPYSYVLTHLHEDKPWAEGHGFDTPIHRMGPSCINNPMCDAEIRANYEMLTIAWRELIRERLGAAA